jgi:integrase
MAQIIDRTKQSGDRYQGRTRKRWTVRWTVDGRQSERSFTTKYDAESFRASVEHETRAGTYADPKLGQLRFADYAAGVIRGMDVSEASARSYDGVLRNWIAPWAGSRTLAQVSRDREGAVKLLNVDMAGLSSGRRGIARSLLVAVLDEAVTAGRLGSHKLARIRLTRAAADVSDGPDASFVFPTKAQLAEMARRLNGYGVIVYLMRGCGLRISEALAVHREDFSDDGTSLRITGQSSPDGTRKVALKHRRPGDVRDVPVPGYVWTMVRKLPSGPVVPGRDGKRYETYSVAAKRIEAVRKATGIAEGFSAHSLRHAYVSALLASGVPITDVAKWLGHREISVTYKTYGHLVPSAASRAREALDAEYAAFA